MGLIIEKTNGDIFASGAKALVDPSNCVGVKGAGLSLAFKNRYGDDLMRPYRDACRSGDFRPGRIMPINVPGGIVICFPTKNHWRDPSRIEWIYSGMSALMRFLRDTQFSSVAIPALGCGRGELQWDEVYPVIERALEPARGWAWDLTAEIYEPR